MNNNLQNPNNANPQPEFYDRHAERHHRIQERREARANRVGGAWIGGVMLIALGTIFLLDNLKIFSFGNWWALFFMLPAMGAFGSAWRTYQNEDNRLTASARSSLVVGLVFTALTMFFLFDINLAILGPALIILVGLWLVVNGFLPK
ncbi:MAG: hypothetical protein HUU38_27680 [Anaerolineales bacterium]|nr:hypothetical protein [Anaerolineales bacterium]